MNHFNNKRVYITGGSSGIGLALARHLASLGAHLLLFARDAKRLETARAAVEAERVDGDRRIAAMPLDVSDEGAVRKTIPRAVRDFGAPDIVINSAGIGSADHFENITYENFDRVMKINLYGTRNVIAASLPHMKERGGSLVIISSMAGFLGMFGYTAYATSKFALVGFSECLRSEVKRFGIRVHLACPPETDTPFLAEESKTIPPESRALKDMVGLLPADYVARYILRGIARDAYLIMPGAKARFLYHLNRFSPGWMSRMIADTTVARVARKMKRR
ncbi:MAG: SDR family oxidoreductase [Spirochaetes bacterium]|nr:SDR family oxidoreductase [Spirochaetota bacterium]